MANSKVQGIPDISGAPEEDLEFLLRSFQGGRGESIEEFLRQRLAVKMPAEQQGGEPVPPEGQLHEKQVA